jgi:hypothetical protein
MAQRQTQQPKVSEGERIFTQQLVSRGYTQDQASQIIGIVQRLRQGQHVSLNAVQSNWVNDITAIQNAMIRVSPETTRVSRLTPEQATAVFSGREMRERDRERRVDRLVSESMEQMARTVQGQQRPAPVRTYIYDVEVDGRRYVVELNREMPSRGITTVSSSRMGQLRRMMSESPSPIIAVRMPDGTSVRPGTPGYLSFAQTYSTAYQAMLRDPESGRIVITTAQRSGRREG